MNLSAAAPIGIFDSGIGGLTVAHKVREFLPHERIIYFGDIAHLPYGDKSAAAIQAYSVKITDVLLQQGCKMILIACNSASAAAFDLVKEYVGSKAKVFNVIDPVVNYTAANYPEKTVGLIGTKQTINSNIYELKVKQLNETIIMKSLATPLLVPMIEEGFFENKISHEIINNYLNDEALTGMEALILGCTHYPLIKREIDELLNHQVDILDSASIVAQALKKYLSEQDLLASTRMDTDRFLVSDITKSFESSAKMFFQDLIKLEKYPIWD